MNNLINKSSISKENKFFLIAGGKKQFAFGSLKKINENESKFIVEYSNYASNSYLKLKIKNLAEENSFTKKHIDFENKELVISTEEEGIGLTNGEKKTIAEDSAFIHYNRDGSFSCYEELLDTPAELIFIGIKPSKCDEGTTIKNYSYFLKLQ